MESKNKIEVTGKELAEKLGIDVSKLPKTWRQHGHGTTPPRELLDKSATYEFEERDYEKLLPVKIGLIGKIFGSTRLQTGDIYDAGYSTENFFLGKSGKKKFSIVIGGDTCSQGELEIEE